MAARSRTLPLSPDELLTTTRSVRRRLDLTRPVERDVLEECLRIAQQAPTGSNMQNWHFVVVTDAARRAALAALYRQAWSLYAGGLASPLGGATTRAVAGERAGTQARVAASANYLAEHLHEVPVHVIPCITGRTDGMPAAIQAGQWAGIIPAAWSFMLAARARGLGTSWTTLHLLAEPAAALLLGIPYPTVMQAGLIPVAYTRGTKFKAAAREPLERMVHWDAW
jgi:nitroreductase